MHVSLEFQLDDHVHISFGFLLETRALDTAIVSVFSMSARLLLTKLCKQDFVQNHIEDVLGVH
jgi:hypothetical protein